MTEKEICPDKHVYARIQHFYSHINERLEFYTDMKAGTDEETIIEIESLIDHLEKIFPDIIYKA